MAHYRQNEATIGVWRRLVPVPLPPPSVRRSCARSASTAPDAVMGPPTMTGYRERVAVPHSDGLTGSERVGPKHRGGTAVKYFAGIDVSLEESSVCVVDGTGKIVREAKVASEACGADGGGGCGHPD